MPAPLALALLFIESFAAYSLLRYFDVKSTKKLAQVEGTMDSTNEPVCLHVCWNDNLVNRHPSVSILRRIILCNWLFNRRDGYVEYCYCGGRSVTSFLPFHTLRYHKLD